MAPGDSATPLPSSCKRLSCGSPPRRAQSCRQHPVPGSVGSAAHTGLFIVGSRRAGAPWQRHSLCRSWRQGGHLHGDPVHVLGWAGGIYLFAGLFSFVVISKAACSRNRCLAFLGCSWAWLLRRDPGWGRGAGCSAGLGHPAWDAHRDVLQQGWCGQKCHPLPMLVEPGGRGHWLTVCHVALMAPPWQWLAGPLRDTLGTQEPWWQQDFCLMLPPSPARLPSSRNTRGVHHGGALYPSPPGAQASSNASPACWLLPALSPCDGPG